MKKELITPIIIVAVMLVLIFIFINSDKSNEIIQQENPQESNKVINQVILNTELKDIATGKTFKVSDFGEKPVLLESFAVWCPTCTAQQKEIKKFHEEVGDGVISISLDTDPNEDESRVLEHIEKNGFDWYYVISPTEFTKALIEEFGIGIVNAPSAPMVLICNNEARKLDSGVKSVSELKKEIERCNG